MWFYSNSKSNRNEVISPCDSLLLDGSVVVNEAVLTGESVPKSKQGLLATYTHEHALDLLSISTNNDKHKRNMVYGGTHIITHQVDEKGEREGVLPGIPRPKNGGCLGYVVRTGMNSYR